MEIKIVRFFPNGNTIVFNEIGTQLPEYQESCYLLFIKFLKNKKVKNLDKISFIMPDGQSAKYLPDHNNWTF